MKNSGISKKEALKALKFKDEKNILQLFNKAATLRRKFFKNVIHTCSIINARCGGCSQDCTFCAQSSQSKADIEKYPLISSQEIIDYAESVHDKSSHLGIVTSGKAVKASKELDSICYSIQIIAEKNKIKPCASLGVVDKDVLKKLKEAGLNRYHHNLETSESFFKEVCSTRDYDSQLRAIVLAKEIGLSVCSGGIFGMGEDLKQRVELLNTLRSLDVDSVPLNFLVPVKGTPLEKQNDLTPLDCLKIIAVARLMMPEKTIKICGGREYNLRDMQSWIFTAGANGLMIGGYLTTKGREIEVDHQMIKDAGMCIEK